MRTQVCKRNRIFCSFLQINSAGICWVVMVPPSAEHHILTTWQAGACVSTMLFRLSSHVRPVGPRYLQVGTVILPGLKPTVVSWISRFPISRQSYLGQDTTWGMRESGMWITKRIRVIGDFAVNEISPDMAIPRPISICQVSRAVRGRILRLRGIIWTI